MAANKGLAALAVLVVSVFIAGCGGGGGGGGAAAPVAVPSLSFVNPQNGASISDIDFRSENFQITAAFSGSGPANASTLVVTLKMDSDAAQNIAQYFSISGNEISSSDIYEFNRSLFDLPSNDIVRTMRLTASVKDAAGRTATSQIEFEVYPDAGLPPPG
ncbi:MAG TPA: hypothetical protein PKH33_02015 [bacterium]|nr:hypothetical protein [bacterium]